MLADILIKTTYSFITNGFPSVSEYFHIFFPSKATMALYRAQKKNEKKGKEGIIGMPIAYCST